MFNLDYVDTEGIFTKAFDEQLAENNPDNEEWVVGGRKLTTQPNGEDEAWWRVNGPLMVERWVEWRQKTPWEIWVAPDGQPAIELFVDPIIGGQYVHMYIDRIFATAPNNQRPVIVDIKSGGAKPDNYDQLGLNKVGVELAYPGVKVAGGAYWSARTGKLMEIKTLAEYTPQLWGERFRQHRVAVAMKVFPPKVTPRCKACGMNRFCAAYGGLEAHKDPDYVLMGG